VLVPCTAATRKNVPVLEVKIVVGQVTAGILTPPTLGPFSVALVRTMPAGDVPVLGRLVGNADERKADITRGVGVGGREIVGERVGEGVSPM